MTFEKLKQNPEQIGQTWIDSVQVTEEDGTAFPADVYRGINLDEEPKLGHDLFEGRLNIVEAPEAKREYALSIPVYIHDPERAFFALYVPPELRHRERDFRRQLLETFRVIDREIPRYFREFQSVFGLRQLRRMLEGQKVGSSVEGTVGKLKFTAESILEDWNEFEDQLDGLDIESYPVDEVINRLAKEKKTLEDVIETLDQDVSSEVIQLSRSKIKESRQALEAEQLRYEQHERWERDYGGGPVGKTEVVRSEDVFENTSVDQMPEEPSEEETEHAELEMDIPSLEPRELLADVSVTDEYRERLDHYIGETAGIETISGRLGFVDEDVWAFKQLESDRLNALEVESVSLFAQFVVENDYPFIGLLLGEESEEGFRDAVDFALDILGDPGDDDIVQNLIKDTELRFALFDENEELAQIIRVKVLLEDNFERLRNRVKEHGVRQGASFSKALEGWQSRGVDRLGAQNHELHAPRFNKPSAPSEVQMAARAVGYWSKPDQFDYLIETRSFPLEQYETMRSEIIQKALEFGIYLPESLADYLISNSERFEVELSSTAELTRFLLNRFAKTVAKEDIDDMSPSEEWENWFRLIEMASESDVVPSSQYMELAESAYERVQSRS